MAKDHWKDSWGQEIIDQLTKEELAEYNARSQKGDIIVVRPDGWLWGTSECLPGYIVIKAPNLSYEDAQNYQRPLMNGEVLTKRRRFNVSAAFVDNVIADGGVLTVTGQFKTVINECHKDSLVIDDTTAKAGDTAVNVPVSLSFSGNTITTMQFDIGFPAADLKVNTVDTGPAAKKANKQAAYSEPSAGLLRVVIFGLNQEAIGSGVLALIKFDVLENAAKGRKDLTLSNCIASDAKPESVPLTPDNGVFIIQ